jgi:hypothetical protein
LLLDASHGLSWAACQSCKFGEEEFVVSQKCLPHFARHDLKQSLINNVGRAIDISSILERQVQKSQPSNLTTGSRNLDFLTVQSLCSLCHVKAHASLAPYTFIRSLSLTARYISSFMITQLLLLDNLYMQRMPLCIRFDLERCLVRPIASTTSKGSH